MMKLPAMHNLSNGGRGLRTDPRIEANEDVSLRAFDLSRSKRIAEEVKLHDWIRSAPVIITAVSDLRFLRMQFQEPGREASLNRIFQVFRLRLSTAMANHIVCIACKRDPGEFPFHPTVERIMQIKICEDGTNDAALRSARCPLHETTIHQLRGRFKPSFDV